VQDNESKHAQSLPSSDPSATDKDKDHEVEDPAFEVLAPYKTSAELQALLHQTRDLYQQDKIFQACRALDTFKQAVFAAVEAHQPIHLAAEPLDTSVNADPCSPLAVEPESPEESGSRSGEGKNEGGKTGAEEPKEEEPEFKKEEPEEAVEPEDAAQKQEGEGEGDSVKDAAEKALEADIDPLCAKVEAVAVSQPSEVKCEEKHHDHQQEAQRVWEVLLQCSPWIAKAYEEGKEVRDVLSLLHDDKGWTPVADSDGIQTMYRTEPGTTIHSVKVHSIVESPVENLCAIANEVDLLPTFLTMVKIEAATLRQVSPLSKVIYCKVHLPWPLDNRDIVAFARGVDLMEQGDIVLVGKNCDYWPGVQIPKVASGVTRLDVHLSGAVFRPLSRTRTKVSAVFNVDFKLAIVPTMLINFFTRKLTHLGFSMFRKQCAKVPNLPAYQQRRLETNKEWYDHIHARIEAYFAQAQLDQVEDKAPADSNEAAEEKKQQNSAKSKA